MARGFLLDQSHQQVLDHHCFTEGSPLAVDLTGLFPSTFSALQVFTLIFLGGGGGATLC